VNVIPWCELVPVGRNDYEQIAANAQNDAKMEQIIKSSKAQLLTSVLQMPFWCRRRQQCHLVPVHEQSNSGMRCGRPSACLQVSVVHL